MTTKYKIHPAIGIARIGNGSVDDYYLGPEKPYHQIAAEAAAEEPSKQVFTGTLPISICR
ncbi:MAG: hypothetical protein ETSY1_08755 [Candidatus Entotheonella factor]|uniref:L-Lysine epsilon oxidase N-terminal domain-containing protein n=1 Tax=Entotheonella factor TaxID=1429438 RepID=W4LUG6_ENTF1|nr:MAG: hypothetical protein ETSY1_08755 [Candidatus Entotheonella factor]